MTILKKNPQKGEKSPQKSLKSTKGKKKRSNYYVNQKYVFLDKNKVWNHVLCIIVGQTIKKIISTTAILDFGL